MSSTMEVKSTSLMGSSWLPKPKGEEQSDLNLREWILKGSRIISRENTKSRRFSASNITSFREETPSSFRSNLTISSTASSPGHSLLDEIDPSTYSFTTALRALQVRSGYVWGCSSPISDGLSLNSKWNEAEKYICNPLSGEVPMECLSSKTLSGRSIYPTNARIRSSRITVSGPLLYSSSSSTSQPISVQTNHLLTKQEPDYQINGRIKEEIKMENLMTRDVGTQSTPPILTPSRSPTSTPPLKERSFKNKHCKDEFSNDDIPKSNISSQEDKVVAEIEEKGRPKEKRHEENTMKREKEEKIRNQKDKKQQKRKCRKSLQLKQGQSSWAICSCF